jgi:hypothetical protein
MACSRMACLLLMANIATATTTMALHAATAATFDVETDVTEIATAEDDYKSFELLYEYCIRTRRTEPNRSEQT